MTLKDFLKEWKPKKMSKDDRLNLMYDALPGMVNFYIRKSFKEKDMVSELFDRMEDPKFTKTLAKVLKEVEEPEAGTAVLVADFLDARHGKLDDDMIDAYTSIIEKLLKKSIKKFTKKTDLPEDLAKELLVVVPNKDYITDGRFVGYTSQKITRKLYALAADSEFPIKEVKQLKKVFKALFNEDLMPMIAMNILLERKDNIRNFKENQVAVWNLVTAFALDTINDMKKKEIREIIELYIVRRQKDGERGKDFSRRINLSTIVSENHEKVHEVVQKLAEKDKYKKYL